jgi:sRNA-binding carbon storage regulator CsrA
MAQGVVHEIEVGETLFAGNIAVTAEQMSGRKVRLRVVAPDETKISRRKNEPGESRMTAEQSV